ncbi:class I SAM-dependent methyltransferase [Blastopirellula retiformator]|uniref:Demethylrebeccamycin-D-glucose O-methyltransferase n=1 Tax=Blastopirellula retiformator TaxID=2527970 RepID=A0A5C5VM78_9BACT|nr:methyltransferase domain-containing protein [Blastopirellula retiformator]TWT38862.1 Demethylrebeccamycin-D-glucose O-methyltransferase [Blastopirellula retiformator]
MADPNEPTIEMMFSFFEGLHRKGPGSEASTLKALALLNDMPPNPRVVDFGCGTGAASIPLAQNIDCEITAVEIHQPFLNELDHLAAQVGVGDRIKTLQVDMGKPTFSEDSFDVIWCEAAIYNVGFEHALRIWKPLLRSGGYVSASEVVWLTPEPPRKAREFWEAEYPSMATVDANVSMLSEAGFTPVDHFVLPSSDWEKYYGPLQQHVIDYRSSHADSRAAQSLADSLQEEIDLWKEYGDSFGYCFFVGRAN